MILIRCDQNSVYRYSQAAGIISPQRIAEIAAEGGSADIEDWKAYMKARFIAADASVLPRWIDEASFAFYGKTLRGTPEQRPRWKRAIGATQGALGELLGKSYVERYFPPENKAAMDELVANLRLAVADSIAEIDWMGEETKEQALEKLASFDPKIGYRPNLETYEGLEVGASPLENQQSK